MRVNVNANGHVYGQVSVEDPAEVDKSALYHEPYNINMYSAQAVKQLQGKEIHTLHPTSPDYTGEYCVSANIYVSREAISVAYIHNRYLFSKMAFSGAILC